MNSSGYIIHSIQFADRHKLFASLYSLTVDGRLAGWFLVEEGRNDRSDDWLLGSPDYMTASEQNTTEHNTTECKASEEYEYYKTWYFARSSFMNTFSDCCFRNSYSSEMEFRL